MELVFQDIIFLFHTFANCLSGPIRFFRSCLSKLCACVLQQPIYKHKAYALKISLLFFFVLWLHSGLVFSLNPLLL